MKNFIETMVFCIGFSISVVVLVGLGLIIGNWLETRNDRTRD